MQIIWVESDIADRIMRDPFVIEEVLRITDREKWKRSGAIDLYGVARDRTQVILSIGGYEELLEDLHDLSIIAERRDAHNNI